MSQFELTPEQAAVEAEFDAARLEMQEQSIQVSSTVALVAPTAMAFLTRQITARLVTRDGADETRTNNPYATLGDIDRAAMNSQLS